MTNSELELLEDNNKQHIYIICFNGENNLLIETDTSEETDRWANALKQHIRYANAVSIRTTQKYRLSINPSEVGQSPRPTDITKLPSENA